jgi:hypothetical protein
MIMPYVNKSNARKFYKLLILHILVLILIVSCQSPSTVVSHQSQSDTTPPVFTNLLFPYDGTVPPPGLLISGTLNEETAFHPTEPIVMEIDILGPEGVISTKSFTVSGGQPSWDTYFDPSTGDFRIEFHDHNRLKDGMRDLRLIGKDAAGNITEEITHVYVEPVTGVDPEGIHNARINYGANVVQFLDNLSAILSNYPTEYDYDIRVIERLSQYCRETYIQSPQLVTWIDKSAAMIQDIQSIPNPTDPVTKAAIDNIVLPKYAQRLDTMYQRAVNPYYPRPQDNDIIALREEIEDRLNYFMISCEVDPPTATASAGQDATMHVVITCIPAWDDEPDDVEEIADFTITASTANDLSITGYIGPKQHRFDIEPDGYNPPLRLFQYFEWSGSISNMVLQF